MASIRVPRLARSRELRYALLRLIEARGRSLVAKITLMGIGQPNVK